MRRGRDVFSSELLLALERGKARRRRGGDKNKDKDKGKANTDKQKEMRYGKRRGLWTEHVEVSDFCVDGNGPCCSSI